ncbi:hypothetical protein [Azospirillum soli]|uniref:hypothetical protein n=1 Tax=Azospirillum soli TaxID=1304799 RepID=UPI001AE7BB8A|nr:hypothetical protein [Azospirillum soli]MBP2315855.1 hypothetical protein [Azospirillum soli]
MNVALATSTASKPLAFMAARNGATVDEGADTRTPAKAGSAADKEAPLVGRYPNIAFSYDADAERLVMLFRDPADGSTVSQIPTEAALKQYKEALKERKAGRSSLALLVGADDGKVGGDDANASARGKVATPPPSPSLSSSPPLSPSSSGTHASVLSSSPAITQAVVAGTSGTGRVNVVI